MTQEKTYFSWLITMNDEQNSPEKIKNKEMCHEANSVFLNEHMKQQERLMSLDFILVGTNTEHIWYQTNQ